MSRLLHGRTAIIYGAGGAIGGHVARTFALEGAQVFLAGRTRGSLELVAERIAADGGQAHVALVDALDEDAVSAHVDSVVADTGRLDVSFNLIGRGDVQGTPLIELSTDALLRAVESGVRSNFLTARAAARRMVAQGQGVILHLNSGSGAAATPGMGSTGPADAATETLMRYLAAEIGPQGVRVCGIWTAAVAGTLTPEKLAAAGRDGDGDVPDPAALEESIAAMSALRRAPRLDDVAQAATFLASDRAAGVTGSVVNVTAGLVLS